MPKTTNELRSKNNPKMEYKGMIIPGKKIDKPGLIGKIDKNKPDRFYNNSSARYMTTTGAVLKPRKNGEIVLKEETKSSLAKPYQGNAQPTNYKKEEARSKYRKSTKNEYKEEGVRNFIQSGAWTESSNDYGKSGITNYTNERDNTQDKEKARANLPGP